MASPIVAASVTLAALAVGPPASAAATARQAGTLPASSPTATAAVKPAVAYSHLDLPDGGWAEVYSDGVAEVHKPGGSTEIQHVPLASPDGQNVSPVGDGKLDLPAKGELIADLVQGQPAQYAPSQVVVVYKPSVTAPGTVSARPASLAKTTPAYTSAAGLNTVLGKLGVDRAQRMFPSAAQRSKLSAMQSAAQAKLGRPLLDFSNAVVLHVTKSSVASAVSRLMASPDVEYAEPDWTVSTTDVPPAQLPAAAVNQAATAAGRLRAAAGTAVRGGAKAAAPTGSAAGVPDNYALSSSAQSLLNRPGVDAVPAFSDLAEKYGQLPGQGEIITNVSLGTLDDSSAAGNPSDPCYQYAAAYGPTTEVINGQRYINWPSMPLIPTYTASSGGTLDPTGETCGDDPNLTEIGLDFSMMAPLPHDQQRAGEAGSGYTDLLGIAPGASYRLVVPSDAGGSASDVDAAFIAAANQTPRPNVITASLGFGTDTTGFSSRYLEDDPMSESIVASIVNSGIVVTISAGDGLRTYTNAAVDPAGGATATDVAATPAQVTSEGDVAMSGAVSRDLDSGSIDVGASTLDDVTAAPPNNPADKALSFLHAYPTTRYDGARNFASGYGSRVNVAAPGDDVLSFSHAFGAADDAVDVSLEGGTSASAPETAAAAAVVLQVARLTRDKALEGNPRAVRSFLEQTGTPLGPLAQSDIPVSEGPQVDVGRAVETLLARAHQSVAPGIARVAVEQRQQLSAAGEQFLTATDPTDISLSGMAARDWITISPDWTGVPAAGVTYSLTGPGHRTLASSPWARLQPSAILAAAGLPVQSSAASRSVTLTYTASKSGKTLAAATFTLTFGPYDGTTPAAQAPVVPAAVTGPMIPVSYDLTGLTGDTDPTLVVSEPGRVDPVTGTYFAPAYSVPLTAATGTVEVPVSRLQGAGVYGIGIQNGPGGWQSADDSAFAIVRVSPAGTAQPQVPTLAYGGAVGAHTLSIPYHGSFQLTYDAKTVPGATGAVAEISAPGPTVANNYNTFNNPNGSERDDNGVDTGSIAWIPLKGTHGTATLNSGTVGLDPAMTHEIRILATGRDGKVVGEASGGATITMNGIAAVDGGSVAGGFGVSATGDDGFLTSNQVTASGGRLGSVETFSQSTGATSTVTSSSDTYTTSPRACGGMLAGDTGLYEDGGTSSTTFRLLSPVAKGTDGGALAVPGTVGTVLCVAGNQSTSEDAVLSSNGDYYVTSANIAAGTFGTPVDISPELKSLGFPVPTGFAEDPATGEAYVAVSDLSGSEDSTVVTVNLTTGAVGTFSGMPGFEDGLAVSQTGDLALEGSDSTVGIYNLATGSSTMATPGGGGYWFPTAIPDTSEFLSAEVESPSSLAAKPDNNGLSSVVLLDDQGKVLHRFQQFNFYNTSFNAMGAYLQVNPSTKTAFAVGPGAGQIVPFSYAGS
jgi:hypothetical protein